MTLDERIKGRVKEDLDFLFGSSDKRTRDVALYLSAELEFLYGEVERWKNSWADITVKHFKLSGRNETLKGLLREVLYSDMAMREEDEGRTSELLDRIRENTQAEEEKAN